MQESERRDPPLIGSERDLLDGFLDFHRDTLLWKVSGLTQDQLTAPRTPSGMSLLGLVKHLAYVERNWFQARFLGEDVYIPWRSGDRDGDFRIEPGDTFDSVIGFYKAEVAASRRIAAAHDLDALATNADPPRTLRWIMIHMIEEAARHNGHADLMRELADGQTGE